MIKSSIYERYKPATQRQESDNCNAWWFIFQGNKLLTQLSDKTTCVPYMKNIENLNLQILRQQYLGILDGEDCYSVEVDPNPNENTPEGMEYRELRGLFGVLEDQFFLLAGKAIQIVNWDMNHQYCSRCGTPTKLMENERAKICPECRLISYPRISPAIIVVITKGDKILLAQGKSFRGNMYSVLAGFVEAGETLEECVQREVMEEVGIQIKNIQYFGSQSWPFPNSLMVGFTAEYESGEINIDKNEIRDAGWFTKDHLPEIPTNISISRELIDWFINR